jgi:hypothetical protein
MLVCRRSMSSCTRTLIAGFLAALALVACAPHYPADPHRTLSTVTGGIQLFGTTVWTGWLMMAAMVVTAIPPVILGRQKLRLAPVLHNKVLYADAD